MKTYTFICGCGHSGTSVLANMFAAHPDVFIPLRETACFYFPDDVDANWQPVHEAARSSGKQHFAEKTPKHIMRLATIREVVPRARFVLMVRDGRDVAASFVKRSGSALSGANRWLRQNRVVLAERNASDVTIARYEDLVASPEQELRRICDSIGIPFHDQMLRFHETERLWFGEEEIRKGSGVEGKEHRALRNWQINQPIFDARGVWRSILSQDDIDTLPRSKMAPMLAAFGYDNDDWRSSRETTEVDAGATQRLG